MLAEGACCRHQKEGARGWKDSRRSFANRIIAAQLAGATRLSTHDAELRGFEIHRFSGEEDAREGATAIGKIESVIPAKDRPFANLLDQFKSRQKLISDWWQAAPDRLIA